MQLSKKNLQVLFALMSCLKSANKKFADQPLEVSVSKIEFINLLLATKTIEKSVRGLYHNLEMLEKGKFILYENKYLKFTKAGLKKAQQVEKDIKPYLSILEKLEQLEITKPLQAHFK